MATRIFAGDAVAVAQVDTFTLALTWAAADTIVLTIDGKTLTVTAADGDKDNIALQVETAWNASTIPEFAEITCLAGTASFTLAANTAGKPFTVTEQETTAGDGTLTQAATTANDGPNAWTGNNFKTGGVRGTIPGAADTVIIRDSSVDILYNLDQSGAGAMTELQISASYTGVIGLDKTNDDGDAYDEYRQRYLALDVGIVDIGDGDGTGSGKIRLQLEGAVSAFTSRNDSASNDDFAAIEVFGNAQTVTLATVQAGSVDFAKDSDETGVTITDLIVDNDGVGRVDSNSTISTSSTVEGGELTLEVASPVLTLRDDATVEHEAGNIATANVLGGTLNVNNVAALTITTANIGTGGTIDTTNASAAVTLASTNVDVPGTINDPSKRIVFSTAVNIGNALISEWPVNLGRGRTWLPV